MSIYFIQCGTNGPIKIGYTNKDVKERTAQLQTACPYELKLLWVTDGGTEEEQSIHENLKHENIRGEWFRPAEDVFFTIRDSSNEYVCGENIVYDGYERLQIETPKNYYVIDKDTGNVEVIKR